MNFTFFDKFWTIKGNSHLLLTMHRNKSLINMTLQAAPAQIVSHKIQERSNHLYHDCYHSDQDHLIVLQGGVTPAADNNR